MDPFDPLVAYGIIGDVVDRVTPSVTMEVFYGTECVTNGSNIKPSIAVNPPGITISGQHSELFTLVMTDPDAPNPSEPSMREWVHWIVTDIPGDKDPTQGNEVVSYGPLCPAIGIHRVVALLFKQQRPLGLLEGVPCRAHFSTRAFASAYNLGDPVAIVFFNTQKESGKRKRSDK